MVDRALLRIDGITVPTGTTTNIVSIREEHVMQNDPRFVPNTHEGVGMKWDHKWREIIVVFDSDTDLFDGYIDDDGPNLPIPTFRIDMTMVVVATQAQVSERWTYHPNNVYVSDRPEGRITEGSERQTFEYHFLCYNGRTVTFP